MNTEDLQEDQDLYEHHRFVADKRQTQMRLDKFVTMRIENATRTRVQKGIDLGSILVNNKLSKSNYQVKPDDVVTVVLPDPPKNPELIPENIPLDIRYEDDELIVINKAAGMVVHPGFNNYTGTLVNALLHHIQQLPKYSDEMRPGLVHRIDKDTSGLILIAKTEDSLVYLAKQFFDHTISRVYNAIAWGNIEKDEGTIRGNLARDLKDRRLSAVFDDENIGKHAVTHYRVLERFGFCTLVECTLETGRTHQIRAHMKHIGHPLFADEAYGGMKIVKYVKLPKYEHFIENCMAIMPRQALHARTLGFIHPKTRKPVHFESALPQDFQSVLDKFRSYTQ